jgi:hypothetical protein
MLITLYIETASVMSIPTDRNDQITKCKHPSCQLSKIANHLTKVSCIGFTTEYAEYQLLLSGVPS